MGISDPGFIEDAMEERDRLGTRLISVLGVVEISIADAA